MVGDSIYITTWLFQFRMAIMISRYITRTELFFFFNTQLHYMIIFCSIPTIDDFLMYIKLFSFCIQSQMLCCYRMRLFFSNNVMPYFNLIISASCEWRRIHIMSVFRKCNHHKPSSDIYVMLNRTLLTDLTLFWYSKYPTQGSSTYDMLVFAFAWLDSEESSKF